MILSHPDYLIDLISYCSYSNWDSASCDQAIVNSFAKNQGQHPHAYGVPENGNGGAGRRTQSVPDSSVRQKRDQRVLDDVLWVAKLVGRRGLHCSRESEKHDTRTKAKTSHTQSEASNQGLACDR